MKTFDDLLDEFLAHIEAHNYSPRTCQTYRFNLRAFLRWLAGRYPLHTVDRLNAEHLDAWVRYLHAYRTSKGLPLKPMSVNKQIESVRGFVKFLAARGYLSRPLLDALRYVKAPKLLPSSVLSHAQVKRLLGTIDTTTPEGFCDRAMLELLYSTGIRRSELLGLDVRDVDLDAATAIVTGKGGKQRVVPIGKTALRYIESYIKGVRSFLAARGAPTQAEQPGAATRLPLFLNRDGRRLRCETLRDRLHAYAARAGLDVTVTPHTFRRSCTTELIRAEANMYHVKELLGHEDLDTLKHYARLTIIDLKKTHAKCHPRERDQ